MIVKSVSVAASLQNTKYPELRKTIKIRITIIFQNVQFDKLCNAALDGIQFKQLCVISLPDIIDLNQIQIFLSILTPLDSDRFDGRSTALIFDHNLCRNKSLLLFLLKYNPIRTRIS